jgi:hypothetical protein
MTKPEPPHAPCPTTSEFLLRKSFIEHRARVLELAAFLDRLDRTSDASAGQKDFRVLALQKAIQALLDPKPYRVDRVHEILSDPSKEPLESAKKSQGAHGAPKPHPLAQGSNS